MKLNYSENLLVGFCISFAIFKAKGINRFSNDFAMSALPGGNFGVFLGNVIISTEYKRSYVKYTDLNCFRLNIIFYLRRTALIKLF